MSLTGNELNNVISGNSGDDTLLGGAGNDVLYGYQGNDTISGGDGNDRIYETGSGLATPAATGADAALSPQQLVPYIKQGLEHH